MKVAIATKRLDEVAADAVVAGLYADEKTLPDALARFDRAAGGQVRRVLEAERFKAKVGEVLYNLTLINAMLDVEAVRTAMTKYGNKPLTGEQVRWGMENLNLTEKRLEELGVKGMMRPLRVTCENHEGNGQALVQQWDGKNWNIVSDWIEPMREVVRPKLEAAAVEEGKKLGYTMRDCSKER